LLIKGKSKNLLGKTGSRQKTIDPLDPRLRDEIHVRSLADDADDPDVIPARCA
jgi:hypothetical protein